MTDIRSAPFYRILIVVALLISAYFLLRNFIPTLHSGSNSVETTQISNNNTTNKSNNNSNANSHSNRDKKAKKTKPTKAPASFKYTAPAPVKGQLKGVIELGASGFNSFIVTIDKKKNWKLKKAEWGNSLVYDGMASTDNIQIGLEKFIDDMLDYGVINRNIYFVVSSGALKIEATRKIIWELRAMNYVVNSVTPAQEGSYALQASMPKAFYDQAFMVDIGSGNTKISWMDYNIKAYETYGAKYYVDKVSDSKVYQEVRAVAARIPANKRKICFILGGVAFNFAKQVRKGDERYTILKAPTAYNPKGAKEKAGLNIYKALVDETGCETFVFDWDGNFTIGFLLNTFTS